MSAILDAALDYRRRGISVIPLGANKQPTVRWKRYQTEAANESKIIQWCGNARTKGIAAIFGEVSGGLAARDFDDLETYERWARDYPRLAETLPTDETRRGRQVFCTVRLDCERRFREAVGKPNGRGALKCQGGELRIGVGCYSALPPSVHPSGHVYRWLITSESFPVVDLFDSGFMPCNRAVHRELKTGSREIDEGDVEFIEDELSNNESSSFNRSNPSCLEYSLESLDALLHERVELAIQRSLVGTAGKRHDQIFKFCRELQGIPEFIEQSPKSFRLIVKEWHRRANAYYKAPWEEVWLDFVEGWGNVEFPAGEGPLAMLFAKAVSMPAPIEAAQFESPELRSLVALCRELQRVAGKGPFYLSTRAAGRLLNVTHAHVSRWMRLLCLENILREVSKGSMKSGQASRYQYLGQL